MRKPNSKNGIRAGNHCGSNLKLLAALWPQGPLALVLALVGGLNILDGLKLPVRLLQRSRALNGLAESLSALGGTAQIILGLMLVLVGIGLLWRLLSAWILSVLLLVVIVGVNVAQERWGLSLALLAIPLAALAWAKGYFTRLTILASIQFSVSGILAILAYGVLGSYLLSKGFHPEILDQR